MVNSYKLSLDKLLIPVRKTVFLTGVFRFNPKIILSAFCNEDKTTNAVRTDIRVVSSQTAHRMRQLMRLVVTDGTGTHADVPGYRVGGKTGTAEKPGQHGYDRKRLISSFLGFFPMDDPRYAVFVMVDEPKGIKETFGYATGGWVAAPAVGRVIAAMGPLLGILPQETEGEDALSSSLKQYVHFQEGRHHEAYSRQPSGPARFPLCGLAGPEV